MSNNNTKNTNVNLLDRVNKSANTTKNNEGNALQQALRNAVANGGDSQKRN